MKKLLGLIILFVVTMSTASAKTKRVRVYFVPWDVDTVVAMTPDSVRKHATVKFEISGFSEPDLFVRWLAEEKMNEDPKWKVEDIRLVIDAEQEDGATWSYYASRFALRSERSNRVRPISDSFRAHFSFFYDEKG